MKIKAACIGTPTSVANVLSRTPFARAVLSRVVGNELGVAEVLTRPAEYYVQRADIGPAPKKGVMGVEVRLTGVSRDGRMSHQFHSALDTLISITKEAVARELYRGQKCQIFCVIMLDGEVQSDPRVASYSCNLESKAEWVTGLRQKKSRRK